MGEANRKKTATARLLESHPICCFCGGQTKATELDHVPSRQMFSLKRRPAGMEFPACSECNRATSKDEQIAAMLARCFPDPSSELEKQEVGKLIKAVARNHPKLIEEMKPSWLQHYDFQKNKSFPTNLGGPLNANGPLLNNAIRRFTAKLGFALYYEHCEKIVPKNGGCFVIWHSNESLFSGDFPEEYDKLFGNSSTLTINQGEWAVPEQFKYNYVVDYKRNLLAFRAAFRESFMVVGFVADSRSKFDSLSGAAVITPGFKEVAISDSKKTDPNNEISINARYFVVGYFDLMGQKEQLRRLATIPNPEDEGAIEELRERVMKVWKPVHGFRLAFDNYFQSFQESTQQIESVPAEFREEYVELTNAQIKMIPFSDSVVIYAPISTKNNRPNLKGLFGILASSAFSVLRSIAEEHPVRGGIDIGIGLEIDDEFYGPALASAYTLESKIADYPRIALGDSLVRLLNDYMRIEPSSNPEHVARFISGLCSQFCGLDYDGQMIVDYLGEGASKQIGHLIGRDICELALKKIREEQNRFREQQNHVLATRYALLENYFQTNAKNWQAWPPIPIDAS